MAGANKEQLTSVVDERNQGQDLSVFKAAFIKAGHATMGTLVGDIFGPCSISCRSLVLRCDGERVFVVETLSERIEGDLPTQTQFQYQELTM